MGTVISVTLADAEVAALQAAHAAALDHRPPPRSRRS